MKASIRLKFDMIVEPVEVDGTNNDDLTIPEALGKNLKESVIMFAKIVGSTLSESETIGGQLEVMAKPYDPERPSTERSEPKSVN